MGKQQFSVVAALALVLAACAPAPEEEVGFAQPAPANESVLVVRNENLTEMNIYAVTGSTRWRLGSVEAGQTASLRLRNLLLASPELVLQAAPVGFGPGAAFTFPAISIMPGKKIEMRVDQTLANSSYTCLSHC